MKNTMILSGAVLSVGRYASMCEKSILNIYEKDANLERYFDKIYIEDIIIKSHLI